MSHRRIPYIIINHYKLDIACDWLHTITSSQHLMEA